MYYMEVVEARGTWLEVIRNDMEGLGLASADALDNHS